MKNLFIKNTDVFSKGLKYLSNKCISKSKNLHGSIGKLVVNIHVQKIEKIYDYFILQSICLLDTMTSQKPKLKVLKCKYTFGSKAFSYSCKTTLRKRKMINLIVFFDFVMLSEMKRRHVLISSIVENTTDLAACSFAIRNANVFLKLDEFYFKWNYPIVFTFVNDRQSTNNISDILS